MNQPFAKGALAFLKDVAVIVGIALVISFVVKTFLFRSFYIPSQSMETTLLVNDRIIVNELVPDMFPLEHGDIVVFTDPGGWLPGGAGPQLDPVTAALDFIATVVGFGGSDSNDHLVKRVIGLPGDHVTCCTPDGLVAVNGDPVLEPYANLEGHTDHAKYEFDVTVPDSSLWVLGDNRYNSADSSYHDHEHDTPGGGFVPIANVVGRAMVISWPLSRWTWLDNYSDNFTNAH